MKSSTKNLDAYKMQLVQNFVLGVNQAQSKEEVRNVLYELLEKEDWISSQYTRTEIDTMLAQLTEELQHGKERPRKQVWKEIKELIQLRENSSWYTMEEVATSLENFRTSIQEEGCIPHEQAMKDIEEFMKCI